MNYSWITRISSHTFFKCGAQCPHTEMNRRHTEKVCHILLWLVAWISSKGKHTFLWDTKPERAGPCTQIRSRRTKLLLSITVKKYKGRQCLLVLETQLSYQTSSGVILKPSHLLLLNVVVEVPIMMNPEVSLIFLTCPLSLFHTRWERRNGTALRAIDLFYQAEGKKSKFRQLHNSRNYVAST